MTTTTDHTPATDGDAAAPEPLDYPDRPLLGMTLATAHAIAAQANALRYLATAQRAMTDAEFYAVHGPRDSNDENDSAIYPVNAVGAATEALLLALQEWNDATGVRVLALAGETKEG